MPEPTPGTTFQVGDPEVQDNWEKKIWRQYVHRTVIFNPENKLIGDEKSLVERKSEPFNEAGTRATTTLVKQLQGAPTYGDQLREGREEGVSTDTFRWEINKVSHQVAVIGEVTNHRVSWNVIKTSSMLLGEWFAVKQEYAAMMHLTGFNIDAARPTTEPDLNGTDLGRTWGNAPTRADAAHTLYVNDKIPGNFVDTDIIDLPIFSDAVALAQTYPQPLRPIRIYGDDYYVVFVHPYTVRHWKDSGTRWWEIATKAIEGGMINGNPVVRGTLGCYDGCIFMSTKYMPPAVDDSTITALDGTAAVVNTRAAVLCGQQSLVYGIARRYKDENTIRKEDRHWNYGGNVGVGAHTMGGLACPKFTLNGSLQRFSTVVIYGYARDLITPA